MTEIHLNLMYDLPTELLINIFEFLPAKELMKCRKVCLRWKEIIDLRVKKDDQWKKFTVKDFSKVYRVAANKSYECTQWYDLYRSLSLWPKINSATETTDEFASATQVRDEIRDFVILSDGMIGVHKKTGIMYYNIDSLEKCKREPMHGDFAQYAENDDTVIILGNHLHLHIIRKIIRHPDHVPDITFNNIKVFLVADRTVYFISLNNEISLCNLDENLKARLLKKSDENIMTLSYCKGHLCVLTYQREIYKLVDEDLIFICLLDNVSNCLDCLWRYNFLDSVDWRVYFEWMVVLQHKIPEGPLRNILTITPYEDVYLVGSNYGVLRIYIAPYIAGELDIYSSEPVKQYNFMERCDCPVLSLCPILQIDVMEVINGHKVIVAMPKKIAVLNFIHHFDKEISFKVYQYSEDINYK